MKVYKAINAVQAALSAHGIEKSMRNQQGAGYNFRGIDQVYNALAPLLAKHGLCILPRVVKSEQTERSSSAGKVLIYSYITMEFDLVAAEDGSKHTICTVGEAFDSGDKSMNKAMSAAYKYAAFQSFAIPTEGDNDADSTTHEVAAPPVVLPPYTDADFSKNLPAWAKAMQAGRKTATDVIDTLSTRYTLTAEQEEKIRTAGKIVPPAESSAFANLIDALEKCEIDALDELLKDALGQVEEGECSALLRNIVNTRKGTA